MKLVSYSLLYLLIALLVIENQLIVAVLASVWFTYKVGAFWLIPLAFLLDGYFGAFHHIPFISLIACLWYVASEFARPRLFSYSNTV